MKTRKTFKAVLYCISLIATVSCTDKFEEINTNSQGASQADLNQDFRSIKSLYARPFAVIIDTEFNFRFQRTGALGNNLFAGYTSSGFGGNGDFNLNSEWNRFHWTKGYLAHADLVEALRIINQGSEAEKENLVPFEALAMTLKVLNMHRITDIYGPAALSNYGKEEVLFDTQEDIYVQLFKDLDRAIELFGRIKDKPTIITSIDNSNFGGDYKKWGEFANSLRLRMAMRIVKVNATLAKSEAEKAIANSMGVLTSVDDNLKISPPTGVNTLQGASDFGSGGMGADMEIMLLGYKDPRISFYFDKTTFTDPAKVAANPYKGFRNGIAYSKSGAYNQFSRIGSIARDPSAKTVWMTTAEVYFLRAEGALRGWNMGGTAKNMYEQGIRASFDYAKVTGVDSYITDNSSKPIDYVDISVRDDGKAKEVDYSTPALSKITIAWEDSATNEVKLERIITQKWIAIFPDGLQAWSDYRRTGYPKLIRPSENLSGGLIETNLGVRRLPFSVDEAETNPKGVKSGVEKLGGPDTGGTRLWWDTTGSNF